MSASVSLNVVSRLCCRACVVGVCVVVPVFICLILQYFELINVNKAMFMGGRQFDDFEQNAATENEVFFDYLTNVRPLCACFSHRSQGIPHIL